MWLDVFQRLQIGEWIAMVIGNNNELGIPQEVKESME